MSSIPNGGHVECLRDKDITEMKSTIDEMHKRMFVDNGKESIQTALATGAARFRRIEELLTELKAHVASLASSMKSSNEMQDGLAGESLTVEGLVREVLKRIPAGSVAGSSNSAMWVSLAVVCICATIIVVKVW